jgi:hypothetical protein
MTFRLDLDDQPRGIEAFSRNDVFVLVGDALTADVIADWAEAILDGNPDDSVAREIHDAIRS